MDTLYDHNSRAAEQHEDKEAMVGNKDILENKRHTSTFDMIPVLTSKRMRKEIKAQIKEQLEKING